MYTCIYIIDNRLVIGYTVSRFYMDAIICLMHFIIVNEMFCDKFFATLAGPYKPKRQDRKIIIDAHEKTIT